MTHRLLLLGIAAIAVTIVVALVVHGTDDYALIAAASEGNLIEVKELAASGANINASAFDDRKTPLIAASLYGHLDVVEFLADAGADLNKADGAGTAMYWAAFSGHPEIFDFLAGRGARLECDEESLSRLLNRLSDQKLDQLKSRVIAQVTIEKGEPGCTPNPIYNSDLGK